MEEKIVIEIPIEEIAPNPYQPRKVFSEKSLEELKDSIESYGVLQPITVRKKDDKFELVAGERRLRAAKLANLKTIPAILYTRPRHCTTIGNRKIFSIIISY